MARFVMNRLRRRHEEGTASSPSAEFQLPIGLIRTSHLAISDKLSPQVFDPLFDYFHKLEEDRPKEQSLQAILGAASDLVNLKSTR